MNCDLEIVRGDAEVFFLGFSRIIRRFLAFLIKHSANRRIRWVLVGRHPFDIYTSSVAVCMYVGLVFGGRR